MNVNYLDLANHPIMWLASAIAISVVILQSVIFIRKSLAAAEKEGITRKQVSMAVKSSVMNCTPKVGQESQRKGCRNLWEKNCSVRN